MRPQHGTHGESATHGHSAALAVVVKRRPDVEAFGLCLLGSKKEFYGVKLRKGKTSYPIFPYLWITLVRNDFLSAPRGNSIYHTRKLKLPAYRNKEEIDFGMICGWI